MNTLLPTQKNEALRSLIIYNHFQNHTQLFSLTWILVSSIELMETKKQYRRILKIDKSGSKKVSGCQHI